ncbi:ras GEF [Hymenopellis radicata]|nr:ras GEF [Hymenopellis radicata]
MTTPTPTPTLPPISIINPTDDPRPDTPLASRHPPEIITTVDPLGSLSPASSAAQSPTSSTNSSQASFMLPVPTPSSNGSQASFSYVEGTDNNGPLPPEIAGADISIAPDGSFVETSSGAAARELKRRYDQHYGVNLEVRSPYAITAFVNQHGKPTYRVGHRGQSAPAASAAEAESSTMSRNSLNSVSPQSRTKRRSRMSVHAVYSVFKNTNSSSSNGQSRKLRKTRSIPDLTGNVPMTSPPPMTRTHSHSVTSIDAPRLPEFDANGGPSTDLFGAVMDWSNYSSPISSSSASQSLDHEGFRHQPDPIAYPFGRSVMFSAPRKLGLEHLRQPRHLREMQSFESARTARQSVASDKFSEPLSPIPAELYPDDQEPARPPSAIRIRPPLSEEEKSEIITISPDTAMHSRFSGDVFDVIQTYRGVPTIDKLLSEAEDTDVIRLTYNSEEASAPRNDPRFVIWGEIITDGDDVSLSQDSYSSGARSSSISKRRSRRGKSPDVPNLRLTSGDDVQKVIIAASIERWIAQLTSELNYDELLNFFLTYRTYVGAVDLCHLLICRFHWALQKTNSNIDDTVRRIVRLRTFVAFRYWLLTFFTVDFLPNRDLRLLFASWINSLMRDPVLVKYTDGLSIVKKLKKVAQDCKKRHTRTPSQPKSRPSSVSAPGQHLLGQSFAEATKNLNSDEDEDDLDLDFVPQYSPGRGVLSPTGITNSMASSSLSILHRTDYAPGPEADMALPFVTTSATLPIHSSALSRALVKTIGRLGRWKRVLNSNNHRATAPRTPSGVCTDVSAFDLELSVSRDLLTVHGGVEQYLKLIDNQPFGPAVSSTPLASVPPPPPAKSDPSSSVAKPSTTAPPGKPLEPPPGYAESTHTLFLRTPSNTPEPDAVSLARTSSTESFGEELSPNRSSAKFAGFTSPWQFDVVSIDDLDLSDSPSSPPGLRRPHKKLPLRRDFEFVRRSDTVSSMNVTNRDSVASEASSAASSASVVGLGGPIQQWQINALVDSLSEDGERGDANDALKRLEGQINVERQQEKASKVDGWVRTMQERLATGDYEDEPPRLDDDEFEGDDGSDVNGDVEDNSDEYEQSEDGASQDQLLAIEGQRGDNASTPVATQTSYGIPTGGESTVQRSPKAKPDPEDVVPMEILQSRMPSDVPSILVPNTSVASSANGTVPSPSNVLGPDAQSHRSYILAYPSETFAQIFTMIDKDLFTSVKFEELILDDWMGEDGKVDIYDWAQYLKDRSRWTAEKRFPAKTSALAALRARFNLMANFTVSEIVLTPPVARHTVVGKLIRIAWKCWQMNNFNTLVAIISGMNSHLVWQAMKGLWQRLSGFETRLLKDLRIFTSGEDSFKYIRHAVDAIVDAKPIEVNSRAPSVISGGGTNSGAHLGHSGPSTGKSKSVDLGASAGSASATCIPFIGIYLSQLTVYSRLPDLIDPTAPHTMVSIDPLTWNYDTLSHPEVFDNLQSLPPGIQMEPLINVHKQRLRAGVIKRLVAGQHIATGVQWGCDRKLLQKCLRMRAIPQDMCKRALGLREMASPGQSSSSKSTGKETEWLGIHV